MTTLWFSYSMGDGNLEGSEPLNSPYTITWNLARFLRARCGELGWGFQYRNLDDTSPADIQRDDIVIGHTLFDGGFMDIAFDASPRNVFVIQPFTPCMASPNDTERVAALIDRADHYFAITGPYWYDRMNDSPYARLFHKTTRLDMAVNPNIHPHAKKRFNPRGQRRMVCIGNTIPAKGMDRVATLAKLTGTPLGYYGMPSGDTSPFQNVPHFRWHGGVAFTHDVIAKLTEEYDFFVTMGRCDANPTTLLEASLWGLYPLCTPQSGYYEHQPFGGLSLTNMASNAATIDLLQWMSDYELQSDINRIIQVIREKHTWEIFCNTVWQKMTEVMHETVR